MGDVTPIRGESSGGSPPAPPKARRPRRKKGAGSGLLLRESDKGEGFTTMDVVNGLHGVCFAAQQLVQGEDDINVSQQLHIAAMILSSILEDRIEF
jgi:hypothetical protein